MIISLTIEVKCYNNSILHFMKKLNSQNDNFCKLIRSHRMKGCQVKLNEVICFRLLTVRLLPQSLTTHNNNVTTRNVTPPPPKTRQFGILDGSIHFTMLIKFFSVRSLLIGLFFTHNISLEKKSKPSKSRLKSKKRYET